MKIFLPLLTLLWVTGSFAQVLCTDAFELDVEGRAAHAYNLRKFAPLKESQIQRDADMRRRLAQHLFMETDFFLKDLETGRWVTPTPVIEKQTLKGLLAKRVEQFEKKFGSLDRPLEFDAVAAKLSVSRRLRKDLPLEIVQSFAQIKKNPDYAAEILTDLLSGSKELFSKAREEGVVADALLQKAEEGATARRGEKNERAGIFSVGLGSALVMTVTGVAAAYAPHIPIVDMIPYWKETVVMGTGPATYAYAYFPVVHKVRGYFKKYKERRAFKSAVKKINEIDVRALEENAENTDFAFEKGWEEWKNSVMKAEAAKNPARLERVVDRMERISFLIEEMRLWQLPSGESYSAVARLGQVWTEARVEAINEGAERKISQMQAIEEELSWIESDAKRVLEELEGADPAVRFTKEKILTAILEQSIPAFRQSLDDRREEIAFVVQTMDLGENRFRSYVEFMKAELEKERAAKQAKKP